MGKVLTNEKYRDTGTGSKKYLGFGIRYFIKMYRGIGTVFYKNTL